MSVYQLWEVVTKSFITWKMYVKAKRGYKWYISVEINFIHNMNAVFHTGQHFLAPLYLSVTWGENA